MKLRLSLRTSLACVLCCVLPAHADWGQLLEQAGQEVAKEVAKELNKTEQSEQPAGSNPPGPTSRQHTPTRNAEERNGLLWGAIEHHWGRWVAQNVPNEVHKYKQDVTCDGIVDDLAIMVDSMNPDVTNLHVLIMPGHSSSIDDSRNYDVGFGGGQEQLCGDPAMPEVTFNTWHAQDIKATFTSPVCSTAIVLNDQSCDSLSLFWSLDRNMAAQPIVTFRN